MCLEGCSINSQTSKVGFALHAKGTNDTNMIYDTNKLLLNFIKKKKVPAQATL